MKLKTRLILVILCAAMLPLVAAMVVAHWYSSDKVRTLTLNSAQAHLRTGAERLSSYFAGRLSEISIYAQMPLVQGMDWRTIGPFLKKEHRRHGGTYEKLVIGTPQARYYSTSGGNPAYGGLTSFNDTDPNARLKSMAKRQYWQYLVGENTGLKPRVYVSDPIISYTTGVRQVLVGVTIFSDKNDALLGLVAGTIQWSEIENLINRVNDDILRDFGRSARLCMVTRSGIYAYHWDPQKTIRLKKDALGNPILNDIGEKVTLRPKITDESSEELAEAGKRMIRGKNGFAFYTDPETGEEKVVVYAPVPSADYAMAMVIDKNEMMAPVKGLRWSFLVITLVSVIFVVTVSVLFGRMIVRPLESLTHATEGLSEGRWQVKVASNGSDEVGDLARAFTRMARALEKREQELKEREEDHRQLIRNLPIGLYRNRPEGKGTFLIANNTLSEMFGFDSVADFIKTPVSDLYDNPADRKKVGRDLIENGSITCREIRMRRKDGSALWAGLTAKRVTASDGSLKYFEGMVEDLSDRKQAEAALRESEDRYRRLYEDSKEAEQVYRSLINSSADAIVLCNLEGKSVYLSPAFTEMFGWSLMEMEKGSIPFIPEGERSANRNLYDDVIQNGTPIHGFETKRTTKSGRILHVSISASRYNDHKDDPIGLLVVLRDISDRIKLERQLQQAVKMEAIGTLAGGIAHDFNNLMMGMLGNVSLLLMDIDPNHPKHDKLKNIEKLIQSGSRLTSQLLGYARKGQYEIIPMNLNLVVKETAETLERTRKEIILHYDLAQDLFALEGDQTQIEQLLMNLFVNASDAMPGGGDLYLKTANTTHDAFGNDLYDPKPGCYLLIEIRDTGIGMEKKVQRRIFDPFFTTKEMGRGTGLGLASAYGIVKGHGGYIEVVSEKGVGSTFRVYLPVSEKGKIVIPETPDRIVMGQETVLIVDDEEIVLDIGVQMLEKLGYDVLSAAGGDQAVEMFRQHHQQIHMVILDMIMPDVGGGEVFDRIRQIDPNTRVLLSSGYSIDGQAKQILERGCNGFIQKPFDLFNLSKKIREILDDA